MFSDPNDNKDLRGLIADMEENIDNFRKTNRYYDVLGQLYVAFLRYANTSNDLDVLPCSIEYGNTWRWKD